MSITFIIGLDGVSMKIAFVDEVISFSISFTAAAKENFTPFFSDMC